MKKTRFLASIALLACAAFAVASHSVVEVFRTAYRHVRDFVFDVVATVAGPVESMAAPAVQLVQAKAFVLRLAKRERPVVTASWRMCPST